MAEDWSIYMKYHRQVKCPTLVSGKDSKCSWLRVFGPRRSSDRPMPSWRIRGGWRLTLDMISLNRAVLKNGTLFPLIVSIKVRQMKRGRLMGGELPLSGESHS